MRQNKVINQTKFPMGHLRNIHFIHTILFNIVNQTIFNTWKNNFKKHLQCTLQTSHINENDETILRNVAVELNNC